MFGSILDNLPRLLVGRISVKVSYEALNAAAANVLRGAERLQAICEQLYGQCDKMHSYWQSEACDINENQLREEIETIEELATRFRSHAQNLQSIAQNYLKTSGDVSGVIQGLSSDVIV